MRNSFTIIELLFVFIIISILSVAAIPKFIHIADMGYENNLKAVAGTLNRIATGSIWGNLVNKTKNSLAYLDEDKKMLTYYINVPKNLKTTSNMIKKTGNIGLDKVDLKLTATEAEKVQNVSNLPKCETSKGWIIVLGKNNKGDIKDFEVKIGKNYYKMILCDNMLYNPLNFLIIKSTDNENNWTALK